MFLNKKQNNKLEIAQSILTSLTKKYMKDQYDFTKSEIEYMKSFFFYIPKSANVLKIRKTIMKSKKAKLTGKFNKYTSVVNGFEYITDGAIVIKYPVTYKKDGQYDSDDKLLNTDKCLTDFESIFNFTDEKIYRELTFKNVPEMDIDIPLPEDNEKFVSVVYLRHILDLQKFFTSGTNEITGILYGNNVIHFKIQMLDILVFIIKPKWKQHAFTITDGWSLINATK